MKQDHTIRAVKIVGASVATLLSALSMMGCGGPVASPSSPGPAVGKATVAFAAGVQIFQTGWQPFQGTAFNVCANEGVRVTGEIFLRETTHTDANGGVHVTQAGYIRATGVGALSGTTYVFKDTTFFSENDFPSGAFDLSFTLDDELIQLGSGPASGILHINGHLTTGTDGVPRSDVQNISFTC